MEDIKKSKGKGLDIGTAFIVCAEKESGNVTFRSQRNAFFEVEKSDFIKNILTTSKVKYIMKEDKLYVVGDEALEFANMFNKETRRPLSRGVISPKEKDALPMVELLIKTVLGQPSYEKEVVYYSVPGQPLDAEFNVIYHERIFNEFLKKIGYNPKPINEGYAIVLSELANNGFTGIGMSFGAGMVNVCLSFKAVPVFSFSLTKAGDWIDQQVSMAVNETASKVCAIKETSLDLSKHDNLTKIESALSIYYNHLIEYVIENVKEEFSRTEKAPQIDKPIDIVLSGGTSMPKGFAERFKEIFEKSKFPLKIGEVKLASNQLRAVANGALVAATAENE
ncbi:MAG: hypothetical protein AABX74_04605 [Nanoarchaeota archaeon]